MRLTFFPRLEAIAARREASRIEPACSAYRAGGKWEMPVRVLCGAMNRARMVVLEVAAA